MVSANDLRPPVGAKHSRKRIGRGNATGQGTYAGKGLKGQKARSGNDIRPGFEGGQLALIKRLGRKRGFKNAFRKEYAVINLGDLDNIEDTTEISVELLRERGVGKKGLPIKVLAGGELSKKLNITAHRVSPAARKKIEEAGGTVNELEQHDNESSSSAESPE